MGKRRRFTLMPAIVLAGLSLLVTVPALSSMHLYAAGVDRYQNVAVKPGDTLWAIASSHTASDANVQEAIDQITQVNHLHNAALVPGQRLRVPI